MAGLRKTFGKGRHRLLDEQQTTYIPDASTELETIPEARLRAPVERPSLLNRLEGFVQQTEVPILNRSQARYQNLDPDSHQKPGYLNFASGRRQERRTDARKRYFGFRRRRTAVIVGSGVSVCVVLAIILAAVLGTRAKKAAKGEALPVQSLTGIAAFTQDDARGITYGYYQAADGTLRERQIQGTSWKAVSSRQDDDVVVASSVATGSPIAAISHNFSTSPHPTTVRMLFYQHRFGIIMSTNRTDGTNWTDPLPLIETYEIIPGNIALTAFSLSDNEDSTSQSGGIQVYYGSLDGGIGELRYTGTAYIDASWTSGSDPAVADSDNLSGAAISNSNDQLHIYFRNKASGSLDRWQYSSTSSTWTQDWTSNSTPDLPPVATGSDIAVCSTSNPTGNDQIFYQTTGGNIILALASADRVSKFQTFSPAAAGSKLSAICTSDAASSKWSATVYYQAPGMLDGLSFVQIDQDGNEIDSGVVQG